MTIIKRKIRFSMKCENENDVVNCEQFFKIRILFSVHRILSKSKNGNKKLSNEEITRFFSIFKDCSYDIKLILAFRVRVPERVNVISVIIRFLLGSFFFLFFSYSKYNWPDTFLPIFFLREVV